MNELSRARVVAEAIRMNRERFDTEVRQLFESARKHRRFNRMIDEDDE